MRLRHFLYLRWRHGFQSVTDLFASHAEGLTVNGGRCLDELVQQGRAIGVVLGEIADLGPIATLVTEVDLLDQGRRAIFQHSVVVEGCEDAAAGHQLLRRVFRVLYGPERADQRRALIAPLYNVLARLPYEEGLGLVGPLLANVEELQTVTQGRRAIAFDLLTYLVSNRPELSDGIELPHAGPVHRSMQAAQLVEAQKVDDDVGRSNGDSGAEPPPLDEGDPAQYRRDDADAGVEDAPQRGVEAQENASSAGELVAPPRREVHQEAPVEATSDAPWHERGEVQDSSRGRAARRSVPLLILLLGLGLGYGLWPHQGADSPTGLQENRAPAPVSSASTSQEIVPQPVEDGPPPQAGQTDPIEEPEQEHDPKSAAPTPKSTSSTPQRTTPPRSAVATSTVQASVTARVDYSVERRIKVSGVVTPPGGCRFVRIGLEEIGLESAALSVAEDGSFRCLFSLEGTTDLPSCLIDKADKAREDGRAHDLALKCCTNKKALSACNAAGSDPRLVLDFAKLNAQGP